MSILSVTTNWSERPINGYRGYYVTDAGEVISYLKGNRHVLSASMMGSGYLKVSIKMESTGAKDTKAVHRLVCETFNGPCPDGMECCHNDGNKLNNAASNLRWGTKKENSADCNLHGTDKRGAKHPLVKITEETVRAIRADSGTMAELALKYKLSPMQICRIRNRTRWAHIQ